jgi:hypothetical protein
MKFFGSKPGSYMTSLEIPYALRARVDALRFARAQREGGLPPTMKDVVLEALELLLIRDAEAAQ